MDKKKPSKKTEIDSTVLLFAHQVKSGLTAIKWSLKMICNDDFGKITKEQKDIIEKTIGKNEALLSLINNLLHASAIEDGKYLYDKSLASIENIIEYVMDYSKEEATRKKIKIEFKKSEGNMPKIMLDKEMVKLAVQNIFDNALKYTPANGEVTIFLRNDKKNIEIQVQDSGIGIPENQKDKLFNRFFRATNAVKMNSEGSGVGLFITK